MHLHMSGLVCHHKGGGETVLVVQGAAPNRVAHACHRSITLATRKREKNLKDL